MADQPQQSQIANCNYAVERGQAPVPELPPHPEGPPTVATPAEPADTTQPVVLPPAAAPPPTTTPVPTATNTLPTATVLQQGIDAAVSDSTQAATAQQQNLPASSYAQPPAPFDQEQFRQDIHRMMTTMLSTLVPALMQHNSTAASTPMNSTQGPAVGHGEVNATQAPGHQGHHAQQAQDAQSPPDATGWDWNATQWYDWNASWSSDSRRPEEDRPYINHLTFPQFDGTRG